MSNPNKIFNFNRPLPEPFDKLKSKKVSVSSKYTTGSTEATITATVSKAVLAFCRCKTGRVEGAVGTLDEKVVAEYKSAEGVDLYHIIVIDATTGHVLASVYDKNTEIVEVYTVGNKARDGAALIFALMPMLLADQEFEEIFDLFLDQFTAGFPNMDKSKELMAILSDNVYRRLIDNSCPAHIKLNVENSGNFTRISTTQLDSGVYEPKSVLAGEFAIFSQTASAAPVSPLTAPADHSTFIGQYQLNKGRILTPHEKKLVPDLEPWYILPKDIISICKHASTSSDRSLPMRNFELRGPAGTGKTEGARAIAAGLGLPYVKYTCSANTEVYDFIGQVFPKTGLSTTGDASLDEERQQLLDMGGITFANVAELMKLPSVEDIDFDPEGAYKALTGTERSGVSTQECMGLVMELAIGKINQLSQMKSEDEESSGQTYTYVETDFIRAIKYGWLVEIQEPTTIIQPGVLVGLNSLLEQTGCITLPTGEVVRRHPDAVVVVTTNISYEGCRGMNQSVIDRMSLVLDIELPDTTVMAQRVMSITGCEDDVMVGKMVQVVNELAEYCRVNGIQDGSYGMRSLIDWVISSEITGDPYYSALFTIISKATADEEDRQALISTVLEPYFAAKRKRKKVS